MRARAHTTARFSRRGTRRGVGAPRQDGCPAGRAAIGAAGDRWCGRRGGVPTPQRPGPDVRDIRAYRRDIASALI